jgi:hypothetical protein
LFPATASGGSLGTSTPLLAHALEQVREFVPSAAAARNSVDSTGVDADETPGLRSEDGSADGVS